MTIASLQEGIATIVPDQKSAVFMPEPGETLLSVKGEAIDPSQHRGAVVSLSIKQLSERFPAFEGRVQFGALHDSRLRLKAPIELKLVKSEEGIVATWEEVDEFGWGATTTDAIEDFSATITQLYFELHSSSKKLGVDLQRVKSVLEAYIEPQSA